VACLNDVVLQHGTEALSQEHCCDHDGECFGTRRILTWFHIGHSCCVGRAHDEPCVASGLAGIRGLASSNTKIQKNEQPKIASESSELSDEVYLSFDYGYLCILDIRLIASFSHLRHLIRQAGSGGRTTRKFIATTRKLWRDLLDATDKILVDAISNSKQTSGKAITIDDSALKWLLKWWVQIVFAILSEKY
jgi:hypothetical protein